MICHELTCIGLSERALEVGQQMDEFNNRAFMSKTQLELFHNGKLGCIFSIMDGGSQPYLSSVSFALGYEEERNDLLTMEAWTCNLAQCLADRKKGAV